MTILLHSMFVNETMEVGRSKGRNNFILCSNLNKPINLSSEVSYIS